jgi:hypothetical protein
MPPTLRCAKRCLLKILHDVRLSPEMLLRPEPGIRARFDAAGHVLVDSPDGTIVDLGPRGFATLALFARPLALGDAIARLEADERSSTDLLPTLSVINMLIEEGALVPPDADRRVLRRALEACIVGQAEALPELFTEAVSGWSPNMLAATEAYSGHVIVAAEAAEDARLSSVKLVR